MKEQWRTIIDHPNYEISNLATVRRIETLHILKSHKFGKYRTITLSSGGILKTRNLHVLVAQAFHGHKPNGKQDIVVDHIDNDQSNNRANNLRLIPQRENLLRSKTNSTGLTGVSPNGKNFKSSLSKNNKVTYLGTFKTAEEAHKAYLEAL